MGKFSNRARIGVRRVVQSRAFLPTVFLLAALVRVLWILTVDAAPVDDFRWYWDRAVDLASGRGFTWRGLPTAYWPVGYPFLLSVVVRLSGASLLAAKFLNVALYLVAMVCAYEIARRLFDEELTARLLVLALAVYPNHIAYVSLTATEIPFLATMLLGVLLLLMRFTWTDALAGIVFGLGCLIKPTMLFVPAATFVGAMGTARRRIFRRVVLVYAALALTIAPWTIRNFRVFGTFVFINNNGGGNLLIGNNPYATGGYIDVNPAYADAGISAAANEEQRDRHYRDLAVAYIRRHPGEALARVPGKLWYLLYKDVEGFYWNEIAVGKGQGSPMQRPLAWLKVLAQVAWIGLLISSVLGILRLYVIGRPVSFSPRRSLTGLWIVVYFCAVIAVLFGSTRLHFPLVPLLLLYACAWWSVLLGGLTVPVVRGPWKRRAGTTANEAPLHL